MSLSLHAEDPGTVAMDAARIRLTLETFRREPYRGRAVVAEDPANERVVGYAFLVPFWSNELGPVCEVDELYVRATHRSRGVGRALFDAIEDGTVWKDAPPAAIALGVTASNDRARSLYERVGFETVGTVMLRMPSN